LRCPSLSHVRPKLRLDIQRCRHHRASCCARCKPGFLEGILKFLVATPSQKRCRTIPGLIDPAQRNPSFSGDALGGLVLETPIFIGVRDIRNVVEISVATSVRDATGNG